MAIVFLLKQLLSYHVLLMLVNYSHIFINFEYLFILLSYLGEECGDFVHIWYNNQVPFVAHACKIAFGSVPNFSNCGHFFMHFVYLL